MNATPMTQDLTDLAKSLYAGSINPDVFNFDVHPLAPANDPDYIRFQLRQALKEKPGAGEPSWWPVYKAVEKNIERAYVEGVVTWEKR